MLKKYVPRPDHPLAMAYPFFPLEEQILLKDELGAILNGKLSQGPRTAEFERNFSAFCGAHEGIAFPSCSSALETALNALGVRRGDEVLVPTETFISTGMAVHLSGARPIFTEIHPSDFSMNFSDAWSRVTDATKGAIVVHFGGFISSHFRKFTRKMKESGRFVIEDAAHAHGATMDGLVAGNIGDAGCFSFYPTKIITTGEGGMLVTSQKDLSRRARSLQNRGIDLNNAVESYNVPGRNNRFTEIAAALGLSQLRSLPQFLKNRRSSAAMYDHLLNTNPFYKPLLPASGSKPSYWRYTIVAEKTFNREALKSLLHQDGIAIDWAYSPTLHLQPVFKELYKTKNGMLPASEKLLQHHLCLPMHARLRREDIEYIVERLSFHSSTLF